MNLAIETNELSKRYREVLAVDRISLRVSEGEIYAFLGLNGAGKTTTIRMLMGMIKPTFGTAQVLSTPVHLGSRKPWDSVGYLVETPHAYPELTVHENLETARRLHPGTPTQAVGQIIERLGLGEYADRRAGNLSTGNAQRLGLAKAMLHNPRLLILDEPANGLDPAGIVEIRELLLGLTREQGVTVFMSSHILAEVSRLAQRIGIIHRGRLLQELEIEALEHNRQRRLLLQSRDMAAARSVLAAASYPVEMVETGDNRSGTDYTGMIALSSQAAIEQPEAIASLLVKAGAPPVQLIIEEEDLEQYFLRLIGMNGGSRHG